jgi:large subunit ribosomal protein L13
MSQKIFSVRPQDLVESWYFLDIDKLDQKSRVLGRVASQLATYVMGKNNPLYVPNLTSKNHVVVVNAVKLTLTGSKEKTKQYRRHSGYPGGLKTDTPQTIKRDLMLHKAVYGMLPKNKLRDRNIKHLHIFLGAKHQHPEREKQFENLSFLFSRKQTSEV